MNKKLLNVLKYILGLGFGIFLLYLALRKVEFSQLKENLLGAKYYWVLIALLFAVGSHFFRSLRWRMLLESAGAEARISTSYAAVMVNYLVNQAIPRGGEIARCTMIYRSDDVPVSTSLGTVVTERVIDLICLLLLILYSFLIEFEKISGFFGQAAQNLADKFGGSTGMLLGILAGIGILGIVVLWLLRNRIKALPFYQKVYDFVIKLIEGAKSVFKLKNPWLFLFHTLLIWIGYAVMTYLPFLALEESAGLSFNFAIIVLTAGGLGMAFPSPGGVGSYHVIVTLIFVAFLGETMGEAAANELGSSIAIIIHLSQLIMMIVVGFIAYAYLVLVSPKKARDEANNS